MTLTVYQSRMFHDKARAQFHDSTGLCSQAFLKDVAQATCDMQSLASFVEAYRTDSQELSVLPAGTTWDTWLLGAKDMISKGTLFTCVASCWDLMINHRGMVKKLKSRTVADLKRDVTAQCPTSFPASLAKLLDQFANGDDISTVAV